MIGCMQLRPVIDIGGHEGEREKVSMMDSVQLCFSQMSGVMPMGYAITTMQSDLRGSRDYQVF